MKYQELLDKYGAETTELFWDCECETNYIHPKSEHFCKVCDTNDLDQPDSRIAEVYWGLCYQHEPSINDRAEKTQPVTEEQKALAMPIMEEFGNLCLMSAYISKWDKSVAVICTYEKQPNESIFFKPMAIMVTDDLFDLITPAGGQHTEIIKGEDNG